MTYRASLLGQPVVGGPEGNFHLASRKGQALLYYCLSQPEVSFSRSHLVSLFWEDVEESDARKIFSTSLSRLRQSMSACPLLIVGDNVGFDGNGDDWQIDLQLFQKLANGSSQSPKTPPARVTDLEAAVAMWRGPFLEGFELPGHEQFGYWLQSMRVHWTQEVLSASKHLVEILRGQRAWEKAILYAQKAIAIDPYQEVFHRFLMRTFAEAGNRAVALAQYSKCQELLAEELGVEPDAETMALYEAILRNDLPPEGTTAMVIPKTREVPLRSVAVAVRRTESFVGREEDLAWLRGHLCRGGKERVLVLSGEAGVGKTRLVLETLEHFAEDEGCDPIILGCSCYEESQVLGYAPFVEMLRPLVASLASDPASSSAPWLTELGFFFPDLLVGAAFGSEPTRGQHHFLAAVVSLLAFWQRRIILVLDDLQWADEASLLLLAHLARSPRIENLIVVATMRAGAVRPATRRLLLRMESQGVLEHRRIGGLRRPDLRKLVIRQLGREDEHLVGWLERLTRGNPLFVEEVLRFIQRLGPEADVRLLLRRELPRELRTVVQMFLEELPGDVPELLSVLAIFPKSVPIPLIQKILDLPEEAVVSSLETAVAFGLLEEVQRSDVGAAADIPGLNHIEITFRHQLIRWAIRQEISRPRRRMLHRRVRDLLVREPSGLLVGAVDTSLEETLVYHTLQGGLEAWNWPRKAATLDHPSLGFYLAEILAYLDNLPGDLAAGEALAEAGRRLNELVSDVHRLPSGEGSLILIREAGLRLATTQAMHSLNVLSPETGWLSLLQSLTGVLADLGSDLPLACGLSLLGAYQVNLGEYEEAWRALEKALGLHRTLGNQPETALTQVYLSIAAAGMGRFEQARSLLGFRTEEGAHLDLEPAGPVLLAGIHHLAGEWEPALDAARQALEAAQEGERPLQEYLALSYCGLPLARLGDVSSGMRAQTEAIALAERMGIRFLLSANHAWLAEMRLQAGLIGEAEETARLALRLSPEGGCSWEADLSRRVLGEILLAKGDREAAERVASEALGGCEARGARPEMARCRAVLANCFSDRRGREHYQSVEALMNEMGLKWDLNRLRSWPATDRYLSVGADG